MQQPLGFAGSKRMSLAWAWGLIALFLSVGCTRHSDFQTEGASFLQGVWHQQPLGFESDLLHYTLHEFTFTCDSMYAIMHKTSKSITVTDTCYTDGQWTEYAKAIYVVRGDSLITDGVYAQPNWKQKISGCHQIGQYLPRFKIEHYSADSLVLSNRYDPRLIQLKKVKDITCVPRKRFE
jgi:hypothetical protein